MLSIGQQEVLVLITLLLTIFIVYNMFSFFTDKANFNKKLITSTKRLLVILIILILYPVIMFIVNYIKQKLMKKQSKYLENAKFRIENKEWLKQSKNISIRIIAALEEKKMTKKLLAQKLDVSLKDLNQILKGQEDFSLSLIANFSTILNKELISFPDFKYNKPIRVKNAKERK